jgi:hypothetical protein
MTSEPDVAAGWTQAKLCPGCCVLGDIPEYTPSAEIRIPLVECTRCGFRFPILPLGEPRVLTLHAMRNHELGWDQGEVVERLRVFFPAPEGQESGSVEGTS